MSLPFDTSLRRGRGEPADLMARVDAEVRDRIGEAVDFVCLESMVQARQAAGLPAPARDSARDRAEFDRRVDAFLLRLADAMVDTLDEEQRRSLPTAERASPDRLAHRIDVQLALAKLLPDYWQRFEGVRAAYAADPDGQGSGRDRPRWLDRIFRGA